jgi:hypothetical protein
MLGNPGSNPLELFWDVVDGLDQKLDAKISAVEGVIRQNRLGSKVDDGEDDSMNPEEAQTAIGPDTDWDEFLALIDNTQDPVVNKLSKDNLLEIFDDVGWIYNDLYLIHYADAMCTVAFASGKEASRRKTPCRTEAEASAG